MLSKPLHILQEIVTHKKQEVAKMREQLLLEALPNPNAYPPQNFLQALKQSHNKPSLIAEVKKASPSKGIICKDFDPVSIAQAYERGGAACLSVLCDRKFFRGSFDYLRQIRQKISLPLLCKEFIIDPYQIYRARSCGADAVLLIAAILSQSEIQSLLQLTHSLGMEALIEVHTLAELDRVLTLSGLRLLGINNRNLENFSTDLQTTGQLMAQRRELLHKLGMTIVSESGLHTQADLEFVTRAGVDAVLIGESLVRQTDPQAAINHLFQVAP